MHVYKFTVPNSSLTRLYFKASSSAQKKTEAEEKPLLPLYMLHRYEFTYHAQPSRGQVLQAAPLLPIPALSRVRTTQ